MHVNWIAVFVAGGAYWIFQAAWFTIFGERWQEGMRISPEQLATLQANVSFWPYVIALLCNLLIAYVIARVLAVRKVWGLVSGLQVGWLVGVVAGVAVITNNEFLMQSVTFIAIATFAPVLGCLLMGAIIGAWGVKSQA